LETSDVSDCNVLSSSSGFVFRVPPSVCATDGGVYVHEVKLLRSRRVYESVN